MFLTMDEVAELTGRKIKSKQIEALRKMSVPFRVNAVGKPVVTAAAIEGRKEPVAVVEPVWEMPRHGPQTK